jgi:putative ABC transport system permease protein
MDKVIEDIRIGWRMLARAPGYSVVAVLVLGLGIGATTVIYGVLKGVVLDPLPFPEPDRIVRIRETKLPEFPTFSVAPGNFNSWAEEAKSFEALGMIGGGSFNLTGRDEPLRLRGANATVDYFRAIGVSAAHGRLFAASDLASSDELAVLSHAAWMTHFGGAPDTVGRAIMLNDKSYTVIGILPQSFTLSRQSGEVYALWRVTAEEKQNHGGHYTGVVGRLAPGRTLEGAQAELDTIAARLERELGGSNVGWRTKVTYFADDLLGEARGRLLLLLAGVGLVLLIACTNVASLTLVRTAGRAHEFAIRRAQGASAWRIARQLVTEGLLLGLAGGALGVGLAAAALPVVRAVAPAGFPRIDAIAIDPTVLAVAAMVSLIAGLLAAIVPAALATRRAVSQDLRDGGRGAVGGRGASLRNGLIVAEVALAVVLLAGAGLLGRSLAALNAVDPGFDTASSAYSQLALPAARYKEPPEAERFFAELEARIGALPGVSGVGVVQSLPMASDYVLSFELAGRPPAKPGEEPNTLYYAVSPGYLAAMDIPLLRGRGFAAPDRGDAGHVALASEAFVAKFLPGVDPIGQRVRFGDENSPWFEVVGVVADTRQYGPDREIQPQFYVPFAADPFNNAFIVIDTALPASAIDGPVREAVRGIDRDQPVGQVRTVADLIDGTLASRRFSTWLLGLFAATALTLAAVGLYGTIAYAVAQSRRELGVRMALGARAGDVLALVLRQGLVLAVAGIAIGIAIALSGAQAIAGFVHGVEPRDPLTLAAIAVLMLAVAVAASLLPAWRAARIEPMAALRDE